MSTEFVMPSQYKEMTYEETAQDGGFNWKNATVLVAGVALMACGGTMMYFSSGAMGAAGLLIGIGGFGMTLTEGVIGLD